MMKNKCDCYIEDRILYDYTPLMKPIYKTIAICNGTRKRDRCSCGGDRAKCDFYPEVREKAKKELVVTRADKIRSMTNEELARFLLKCDNDDVGLCDVTQCIVGESCFKCALKWLKEPVREDEDIF